MLNAVECHIVGYVFWKYSLADILCIIGLLEILIADPQDHIRIGVYQSACLKFIHQIHHLPFVFLRSSALNTIQLIKT